MGQLTATLSTSTFRDHMPKIPSELKPLPIQCAHEMVTVALPELW